MDTTAIKALLPRVAPRLTWKHRIRGISTGEPEAALLSTLVDRRKLSIDVGAAGGAYTAHLVPLSRRVIAFEPVPRWLEQLRQMFHNTSTVQIEPVALSDTSGTVSMRICPSCLWRSTIEEENALRYTGDAATMQVAMRTLDEYGLSGVGLSRSMSRGTSSPCSAERAARSNESDRACW